MEGTVILSAFKLYLVCGGYICLCKCVCVGDREGETEAVNLSSWQRNGYALQSHIEMTLIKQIV